MAFNRSETKDQASRANMTRGAAAREAKQLRHVLRQQRQRALKHKRGRR